MEDPATWDLELFLEHEPAETREHIGVWIERLKEFYDRKEDFEFAFDAHDGTAEAAAINAFDRLLQTYGNWGVETLSTLGYNRDTGFRFTAKFRFLT